METPPAAADSDGEEAVPTSQDVTHPMDLYTQHYAHLVNQHCRCSAERREGSSNRSPQDPFAGPRVPVTISRPLFTASQDEKLSGLVNNAPQRPTPPTSGLGTGKGSAFDDPGPFSPTLIGQQVEGRISGVQSYGFFVEVGESR